MKYCMLFALLALAGCKYPTKFGDAGYGGRVGQPTTGTVAAPEINPAGAGAALTLLAGALCVIRGRRR